MSQSHWSEAAAAPLVRSGFLQLCNWMALRQKQGLPAQGICLPGGQSLCWHRGVMTQEPRRVVAHTQTHIRMCLFCTEWCPSPTNSQIEVLIPSTSKYDLI